MNIPTLCGSLYKSTLKLLKQNILWLEKCSLNSSQQENKVMKVLNVAEKNDVAKNLAFFLSGGNNRKVGTDSNISFL